MSSRTIVEASHLSKCFKVYATPRQRFADWLHLPGGPRYHEFWALRDVSFGLQAGECLGIIGPNGAGKSTLLKLLTGVLSPTSGHLAMHGRVLSLLELGSDFSPELTGRENANESLQLLEVPRPLRVSYIDEIEAFAELGDFFDRPVKTYSSGMFVRLAFSLFSTMDPEVFLVDEALTVGDVRFAAKALGRIREMRARGTTLLFVSHDLEVVSQLCTRVVWVHAGQVQADGAPRAVTSAYLQFMLHGGATQLSEAADRQSTAADPAKSANLVPPRMELGRGWQPLEAYGGDVFRWADGVAEIVIKSQSSNVGDLVLELEPGPIAGQSAMTVCIDSGNSPLTHVQLGERQLVDVPLPASRNEDVLIRIWTPDTVQALAGDGRTLAFRLFRWGFSGLSQLESVEQLHAEEVQVANLSLAYEERASRNALARFTPVRGARARIVKVVTRNYLGDESVRFSTFDPLTIEVCVEATETVPGLVVGIELKDVFARSLYRARNDVQDEHLPKLLAGETVSMVFECARLRLGRGIYEITVGVGGEGRESEIWQIVERAWTFEVLALPEMPFHGTVDLE
ncbi:MAG: ABC transporter ATP-binding protein, partial [Chloroflexi bacterium]|nr:ABC transporter ATP-binding protein [Chloroflexota bacterium]